MTTAIVYFVVGVAVLKCYACDETTPFLCKGSRSSAVHIVDSASVFHLPGHSLYNMFIYQNEGAKRLNGLLLPWAWNLAAATPELFFFSFVLGPGSAIQI